MAIALNHGPSAMVYGGPLADAAKKQEFAGLMNPYVQQFFGQEFQSGEAGRQRSWQGGENAAERAQREALQRQQQEWQTGESALDRAIRESLQRQQQVWQSGESALDRALQHPYMNSTRYNSIPNTVGTYGSPLMQKYR